MSTRDIDSLQMLWGLDLRNGRGVSMGLISRQWHEEPSTPHMGEPRRKLLFTTRRIARAIAVEINADMRNKTGYALAKWRVRVVRVRETVELVRTDARAAA